ncbi:MAG: efflux RND transporter permease subunit, partial [Verrucomicrobia bacterium]|nr:efflux RND transporter permease subunit [Verrucomicrobiota bacterium]
MLDLLIRFSLSQRSLILAVAVVLLVLGVKKTLELPVDVLPDLTKPTVTLLTEAKGYAPEEVETLVTIPLENALMGVTGVNRVRSVNDIGLSLIFVEFDWGTDIYRARQFVQERLVGANDVLPDGATPYMTPVSSLMGDIMLVGLRDSTGNTSPRDLRVLADWVIGRRIQSIPGIAEVLTMGGGVKQVQVQPDPQRMLLHRVTFEELRKSAAEAVKNTTGGFLTDRAEEIMVRNLAMTTDLDAIANTVVSYRNDRPILIGDVADVVWDIEPMRGDAGMGVSGREPDKDGRLAHRGVILSIRKSPEFDTIALTEEVETALEELKSSLPKGAELIPLYRQSEFIDLAIGNLKEALRDGAIMVAIVLFLFLFNFRVTLITLTAIPLSLGITVLVFDLMNLGVNSMTLGGLAVAVGMVVDDAIVDVENVYRRLRENAAMGNPTPNLEVIARASGEVRSSIFYATVLIILVFLPLMALSGVGGRLFTPIAIATIVSMAASFIVSLTVIPVLSYFLLKPKAGNEHRDFILVRWLKAIFRATWLRLALSQPLVVLAVTGVLMWFSYGAYLKMGRNFLPPFREPTALVATTSDPGTSLKTTAELSDTAQELLLRIPGIKTVGYRAGRAERGDHVVPVSTVEFDVEFDESAGREREEIIKDIRETMKSIPGTFSAMSGPLADRVGHMLSGVSAKVAIKIFGPDLEELRRIGSEITEVARQVPGMEEARMEQQAAVPQLRIEPDRERAAAYAITPGAITGELASLMGGESVAEIYEGVRVYDLVVRLPGEWRENPERLENLYVDTVSGQLIPLGYVADFRQATGPNTILRENTRRRFVVSVNPTVSDLVSAVDTLKLEVTEKVKLPDGYSISYEGEYQAQKEASRTIAVMSAVILLVVVFLLYSYFQNFSFVILVLTIIPVSLIGAILYTRYTLDNV